MASRQTRFRSARSSRYATPRSRSQNSLSGSPAIVRRALPGEQKRIIRVVHLKVVLLACTVLLTAAAGVVFALQATRRSYQRRRSHLPTVATRSETRQRRDDVLSRGPAGEVPGQPIWYAPHGIARWRCPSGSRSFIWAGRTRIRTHASRSRWTTSLVLPWRRQPAARPSGRNQLDADLDARQL